MNKSLLDTDILSEIIKGIDPTVARNAAVYYQAFGQFTLSAVTVMEIVQGFQKKQSFRKLQSFMARIAAEEVIDFDQTDGARQVALLTSWTERDDHRHGRFDDRRHRPGAWPGASHRQHRPFQRVQQLGYPLALANWRI